MDNARHVMASREERQMRCPQCGSGLPQGVTLCPECGARVMQEHTNRIPEPVEGEIRTILAEANLLRLRRQYDLATAKCVEVLRRYPNNPAAHSLLGDIYRDQSAYADALEWYRLAAQLDPSSALDAEKIQEIEARLQAAKEPAATRARAWRGAWSRLRARPPIGLILGAILGCVLVAALIALSMERGTTRSVMLGSMRVPRVVGAEERAGPPPAGGLASTRAEPAPGATSSERREPAVYSAGKQPVPSSSSAGANPIDREQALRNSVVSAAQAEGLMARVEYVTFEPRDGGATLAIVAEDIVASPDNRAIVLQKCLRIAELAAANDESLTRITVRCAAPVPGVGGVQKVEVVFIGDVNPQSLRRAAGRDLTIEQALALFSSPPWWHERMLSPE
jgi:ribosomal protein S27AE